MCSCLRTCLCSSLCLACLAGSCLFCLQTAGQLVCMSCCAFLQAIKIFHIQINAINTMLQFGTYCITLRKTKQRDVMSMLALHAGAGTAHATSPQHCAVLRSLLGAQQHVLCHRAHEGNIPLFMTSVGTCVTFSQLVTATDFDSPASYSDCQVRITMQPFVRYLQHTVYEFNSLEEAVHLYAVQAIICCGFSQTGKHCLKAAQNACALHCGLGQHNRRCGALTGWRFVQCAAQPP